MQLLIDVLIALGVVLLAGLVWIVTRLLGGDITFDSSVDVVWGIVWLVEVIVLAEYIGQPFVKASKEREVMKYWKGHWLQVVGLLCMIIFLIFYKLKVGTFSPYG